MENHLNRFVEAQKNSFEDALQELKNGKKTTHWMWYIFPQIKGLGKSAIAREFEIQDLAEAEEYLEHDVLGKRLLRLTKILVDDVHGKSAEQIFGYPDFLKFKSCLTLFNFMVEENPKKFSEGKYRIFSKALGKYYDGKKDENTLNILA
ncbi:Uncharacterized protein, DUF1810 family [Kaistella treverensis]|uniref:Uncharacterized protein, DUF1810 family n=1 Tax=Kaistella treverensis TaxID=631455 RepID=A0A1I3JMU3_9FLAO|nr:DUF1810 domain-containing protein [Kaistella treverensis]SFI61484.1 Uncharacterized protein, DUF1810 family [Kaistella treverensis]